MVQNQGIDHRVRLEHLVVRLRQAVLARAPEHQTAERGADPLLHETRQLDPAANCIGGFAADKFRQEVIAATQAEIDTFGPVHRVHRDIRTTVAATH